MLAWVKKKKNDISFSETIILTEDGVDWSF